MSMTPNEEILSIIRCAPGPIGAAAIYEQCKSIETIGDVSSRLSQLFAQGKVDRTEITTAANRKGYAYMLPKAQTPVIDLPDVQSAAQAPTAAELPVLDMLPRSEPVQRKKPGRKPKSAAPKADAVAQALDQVEAALEDSPAAPTDDAAALADAIIDRLRSQLAPAFIELDSATGLDRIAVNIHIDQVDIHLGGL